MTNINTSQQVQIANQIVETAQANGLQASRVGTYGFAVYGRRWDIIGDVVAGGIRISNSAGTGKANAADVVAIQAINEATDGLFRSAVVAWSEQMYRTSLAERI